MSNSALCWSQAQPSDLSALVPLMEAFYDEEQLAYDQQRVPEAVSSLLGNPDWGAVFLLCDGAAVCGYFVLTYGYSAEFGGRFVLLDELYLSPVARGKGEGKRALALTESWASENGVFAVRMEVNRHNEVARSLYVRLGYCDEGRKILTKRL